MANIIGRSLTAGLKIIVADYNNLALEVNRLYSDTTDSLVYTTSNLLLNFTDSGLGTIPPARQTLTSPPSASSYIVVTKEVNGVRRTLISNEYTLGVDGGGNPIIDFVAAIEPNANVRVYDRATHRFGWGQQSSIYPILIEELIRADETTIQSYLESNLNNIIDKVNIIEARIDGPSNITRHNQGDLIEATDFTLIEQLLNVDVLPGTNYWENSISTLSGSVASFTRSADWDNQLVGTMRYTWDSYDDYRYYFNTGSDIRAAITMTGDASNQGYNNWNQVVSAMGSLILNYNDATQTGINGLSEGFGAYQLTNNHQTIYTSGSPSNPVDENGDPDAYGVYSNLIMRWAARVLENTPAAGQFSLDLRVILNDIALNTTTSGTITYSGGYNRADELVDNSAVFSLASSLPELTTLDSFVDSDLIVVTDFTIFNISQSNPAVVTVTPDIGALQNGDKVIIRNVAGMTTVNNTCYEITIIDGQSFSLNGVNSTAFSAYTSGGTASRQERLSWNEYGAPETSFASGFTQNTGYMDVVVSTIPISTGATFKIRRSTDYIYVAPNECFDDDSSAWMTVGSVTGNQGRIIIQFTPSVGVNASANVENLHFRISDIELNTRDERVTVTAFDSNLTPTPITYTLGSSLTQSAGVVRSTVVGSVAESAPVPPNNSALFSVAGPVQRVEILFSEAVVPSGSVWISDVYFEPQPA